MGEAVNYGSICSGVAPQTKSWAAIGLECSWFAEIEAFPSAVLSHRFPAIPNLGDFTKIGAEHGPIDLLVGGTPCQAFSVAGKRAGLDDPRGNLTLEFARLLERLRPRWFLWENVPGVLSIDNGRTFGTFLGILGKLGYGFAYRILDAQYAGVPQRRRRVFVVGHLGDWRRAAAVLFERHSLSGHPAPRRETRERIAPCLEGRAGRSGANNFATSGGLIAPFADVAPTLNAHFGDKQGLEDQHVNGGCGLFVAHALRADGFDASEDGTGRGTPLVPIAIGLDEEQNAHIEQMGCLKSCEKGGGFEASVLYQIQSVNMVRERKQNGIGISDRDAMYTVTGRDQHAVACFSAGAGAGAGTIGYQENQTPTLKGSDSGNRVPALHSGMAVRRLTPRECERLQGFEDDFTLIPYRGKPAADGPRYKAIGNSWAVPVLNWIAKRIEMVDEASHLTLGESAVSGLGNSIRGEL